jgi:glycosyltransferase involved in cell wall biosynthesis
MPEVSVIVPTRNRAEIVKIAIASVLAQTFSNLELIVVVDGPDPATEESLKQISDCRVRVVVNPLNLGLAESRNVGVRLSEGDWIAFLDDDDEWLPEKLAKQFAVAESIQGSQVLVVARFLERTDTIERVWPEILPDSTERFSEYMFLRRGMLLPSTYLVSKQLLLDVPFTPGLRHLEDIDWLLRIAADPRTKIGAATDALVIYNNFHVPGRESMGVRWQVFYGWAVSHRNLFTSLAFSLYIVKTVVPKAKDAEASTRELLLLLFSALLLGKIDARAIFYFFASALFTREFKRRVRELVSSRARYARRSSRAVQTG